ncbi:hypothetical protein PVAND_014890 [Polypedilum vanderplanki]|uniref:Uncharacterized protein n=1 Tax=Polypedilum vanderplanki TaxID=319348 RepID=A0A9J6BBH1_POLVA|nr:hypothetical protein PVAND_014890 [Polypedilum vanderplanki]
MLDIRNHFKVNKFEIHPINDDNNIFEIIRQNQKLSINEILKKASEEKIIILQGHNNSERKNTMLKIASLLMKIKEKWILKLNGEEQGTINLVNKFQTITKDIIGFQKVSELLADKVFNDTQSDFQRQIFINLYSTNNVIILCENLKYNVIENIVYVIRKYSRNEQWMTIENSKILGKEFEGIDVIKFADIDDKERERILQNMIRSKK